MSKSPAVDVVVTAIVARTESRPKVLLQTRSKEDAGRFRGYRELPQGKLLQGESIIDCARREVARETGLMDFRATATGDSTSSGESLESAEIFVVRERGYHDFIALCIVGTATGDPRATDEACEHEWCTREQVAKYIAAEAIFPLNVPMLNWYLS